MKRIILAIALSAMACVSCEKTAGQKPNPEESTEVNPEENPLNKIELDTRSEAFVQRGKSFAFEFVRRVNEGRKKSFVISPLSMQFLLGMILDGARGETADEICRVLGYEAGDVQAADAFALSMLEQLPAVDKETTLSIADAVFVNNRCSILDSYRTSVVQNYDATVSDLDFSDVGEATNRINQWCSDHTNGMITHVLDQVDATVLAYLMNAVYFKSRWKEPFPADATSQEKFLDEEGKESTVPMMKNAGSFLYQENEHFSAVRLPYGNGAFQMTVILPQKGRTVQDVVSVLDAHGWSEITDLRFMREVDVWLPRFETKFHIDLNQLLIEMGMPTAFEELKADFGAMSPQALFLSRVMQDAVIRIDEEGTEAAAVSTGMFATSVPQYSPFHADHPFLYLITESSTGAILFAGKFSGE
jgi:serpin B